MEDPSASAEAFSPAPGTPSTSSSRNHAGASLGVEVLIVLGLYWLPLMLSALTSYFHPPDLNGLARESGTVDLRSWADLARPVFVVATVWWMLRLRGPGIAAVTQPWAAKDFWLAIFLVCLAGGAERLTKMTVQNWVLSWNLGSTVALKSRVYFYPAWFQMLRLVPSTFSEELVMRAFLQTRLTQLGWPPGLVILASTVLQSAYHLYQGVPAMLAHLAFFGILSFAYQKVNRLWPIWIAHFLQDAVIVL